MCRYWAVFLFIDLVSIFSFMMVTPKGQLLLTLQGCINVSQTADRSGAIGSGPSVKPQCNPEPQLWTTVPEDPLSSNALPFDLGPLGGDPSYLDSYWHCPQSDCRSQLPFFPLVHIPGKSLAFLPVSPCTQILTFHVLASHCRRDKKTFLGVSS